MNQALDEATPADTGSRPRPQVVVAVLAFGGIVVSLMQTLVIPLVPMLPELLGATPGDTAWAITATLLAAAIATPTVGRLGDMYGKRRMLLISLAVLAAGSVLCGLATNLPIMVAGRVLQGLAAGVIPLGISIMRDVLPPERLAGATALMSASLGVGGALGLPAAAFVVQKADWHVMFWIAAALAVVVAVLVRTLIPDSGVRTGGRFDLLGSIGLSIVLLLSLLAVSKGSDWGWGSGIPGTMLVVAAVVLVAWVWWELRVPRPLVDLRVSVRRQVLLTNAASVVFGFSMFAMSLVIPQVIQLPEVTGYGFGRTILIAGLVMAPNGLVMMAMSPISARISNAKGPKTTLMTGALLVALGYGLSMVFMSGIWELMIASTIIGAGVGLAYGAMPALVMAAVPRSETAAANSLNTLMRSIGTSVASAVAGVVIATVTMNVGGEVLPARDAFTLILGLGALAALTAFVIAAFLPGRAKAAEPVDPVPWSRTRGGESEEAPTLAQDKA